MLRTPTAWLGSFRGLSFWFPESVIISVYPWLNLFCIVTGYSLVFDARP